MKKLFKSIRDNDIETVIQIIQKKPELVNCIAKQPPKKDDGQSPLQVALKTGNFDIADFLIDMGSNLNFMEDESCCNEWRMPVVHDAINAAVMCSRWNTNSKLIGFKVFSTAEKAEKAYSVLKKMIYNGANVNNVDSHGNSGLWRFCLQANQVLPSYNYSKHCEGDNRIFTEELHKDLIRILRLLKNAGADPSYAANSFEKSPVDFYTDGSLSMILKEVFMN